jgi:hypothetical protein
MKKSRWTLLTAIFVGVLFLSGGVLIAADVPVEITLDGKKYKSNTKGPVKFTHEKHEKDYKIACADCHHVYKDGKNVWTEKDPVQKCIECHDPKKKKGKALKLNSAYHKNCKTCHKNLNKEGKPTGPYKKCLGCHAKKK